MTCQIVWFKRDLRWQDHAALAQAAARGPVRCIYILEPNYWQLNDTALQHFEFIRESLQALNSHLQTLGGSVEIYTGEAIEVFERLLKETPFSEIHSHEETGNAWTYARDIEVQTWCQTHRIQWHEYPQFGVVRRLKNRNRWQAAWELHMQAPQEQPKDIHFASKVNSLPFSMQAPAHLRHNPPHRQRGGRTLALAVLRSFLNARSLGYRGGISSPLSAPDACSRLSTYLAYGCISMREVVQMTRVYNPIKQAQDHDPQGLFVRRWLPAMRNVPDSWLFEPWKMPDNVRQSTGTDASSPIQICTPLVDLSSATRSAKERLHMLRKNDKVRAGKKAVIDKHASRKTFSTRHTSAKSQAASSQMGFDF